MSQTLIDLNRTYMIEEYENLPDDGRLYELLEGRLIMTPPPGDEHGSVANLLGFFLTAHVRANKLGKVWSNGRFVIEYNPQGKDTELAPDIAFIAFPAVPPSSAGAVPIPPHLAVEIQSPTDSTVEIKAKVEKYQKAGVNLISVIQSSRRIEAV